MHLVLVSDEGYAIGLAGTLKSLLDSFSKTAVDTYILSDSATRSVPAAASQLTNPAPDITGAPAVSRGEAALVRIWLIDTGLSEHTWQKIQLMVDAHNATSSEQVPVLAQSLKQAEQCSVPCFQFTTKPAQRLVTAWP